MIVSSLAQNLKAALNSTFRICKGNFLSTMPFLKYKLLKLQLKVFLTRRTVAMVTYCATKMTTTCSPMVRHYFDSMIIALSVKEWL